MVSWKRFSLAVAAANANLASTGPRRWCRGKVSRPAEEPELLLASMGPRRWCRGRGPKNFRQNCRWGVLLWDHDDGVVEAMFFGHSLARSTTPIQWGHDAVVAEDVADRWLNRANSPASMGPGRGSRGREPASRSLEVRRLEHCSGTGCRKKVGERLGASAGRPKPLIRCVSARKSSFSHNDRIANGLWARVAYLGVFATTPPAASFAQRNDTSKHALSEAFGRGSVPISGGVEPRLPRGSAPRRARPV